MKNLNIILLFSILNQLNSLDLSSILSGNNQNNNNGLLTDLLNNNNSQNKPTVKPIMNQPTYKIKGINYDLPIIKKPGDGDNTDGRTYDLSKYQPKKPDENKPIIYQPKKPDENKPIIYQPKKPDEYQPKVPDEYQPKLPVYKTKKPGEGENPDERTYKPEYKHGIDPSKYNINDYKPNIEYEHSNLNYQPKKPIIYNENPDNRSYQPDYKHSDPSLYKINENLINYEHSNLKYQPNPSNNYKPDERIIDPPYFYSKPKDLFIQENTQDFKVNKNVAI